MSRRNVRQERKAAEERDWSWTSERDQDEARECQPDEEYEGLDAYSSEAREFRGGL